MKAIIKLILLVFEHNSGHTLCGGHETERMAGFTF